MFTVARGLFNLLLLKTMRSRSFDWIYRWLNRPWDYGLREKVTLGQTVIFLNQLLKADPEAIQKLLVSRVPCGDRLANHPAVQVLSTASGPMIGLLGILNGLFGKDRAGLGQIIAECDREDGKLKGFWTREEWQFQMDLLENIRFR